ncbi:unnamed protein product [Lactuca virosa]|uniref:RRM domain-containing protein n=1 Tax=Lactuca virosa TaxID=75947 RepID=A0AAU9P5E3_9ASTR|nr:unnamed protein product [Lactuca virosa]
MLPKEGEWTKVRRRKTSPASNGNVGAITNFYVAGFPGCITKAELWKPFGRFGRVIDVYLGGKRDHRRQHFAFVRYMDVEDEKILEEKLQGTKCRDVTLSINLSKHKRKPIYVTNSLPRCQHEVPLHPPISKTGNRDNRTFAQVISNSVRDRSQHNHNPVVISSETQMNEWLKKCVLIGEAHSFDHIGSMPTSLLMNERTKYLGGLNEALGFSNSIETREFLEDKERWKDWFKWIIRANQQVLPYERTAWIKILGLPLHLWDEKNFSLIAGRFGRVIAPFNKLSTRRDYSVGKVGVLTSQLKWINEVVSISVDGKLINVGIVEYTDDWSPFHPAPFDKVEEDSDDEVVEEVESDEDASEEGVSETWMEEENSDMEEEEIRIEEIPNETLVDAHVWIPNDEETINDDNKKSDSSNKVGSVGIHEEKAVSAQETRYDQKENTTHDEDVAERPNTNMENSPFVDLFGPLHNMVPSGCFGPFPNNQFNHSSSQAHLFDSTLIIGTSSGNKTNIGGPSIKKRKRSRRESNTPSFDFLAHSDLPLPSSLMCNQLASDIGGDSCLDLNRSSNSGNLNSDEIDQTTRIGTELGFQLDRDNCIIVQIVGDKAKFLQDKSIGSYTLKLEFPQLYQLEAQKNCLVANRRNTVGYCWNWKSVPVNVGMTDELERLTGILDQFHPRSGLDKWICPLDPDGDYEVKFLRRYIDRSLMVLPTYSHIRWCKMIPIKVTCFVWRAVQGRIPATVELRNRGISIDTTLCEACIGMEESVVHILFSCPFAGEVRNMVLNWCGMDNNETHSIMDLIHSMASHGRCPKEKGCYTSICYGMIWAIWRARNDRIFKGYFTSPSRVVDGIKSMVYLWAKHRSKGVHSSWEEWCSSPVL